MGPDKFTLSELVEAAGVDLEQLGDGKNGEDEAIRSRGMVLMMHITYTNTDKARFSIQEPSYAYKLHKVPFAEYKIAQMIQHGDLLGVDGAASRILWKRYGVRIIFVQTGRIARFSWNALLMEIVAGLTLLSVSQLVCDTYAYYRCPELKELMIDQVSCREETTPGEDKKQAKTAKTE